MASISKLQYSSGNNLGSFNLVAGVSRYLLVLARGVASYVTAGGQSATKLAEATGSANVNAWGLVVPNGWSGSIVLTDDWNGVIHVFLYDNVDPLNPTVDTDAVYSGVGTDTNSSISIDCVLDGYVQDIVAGGVPPYSQGANQTEDADGVSHYTTPVTATVNMTWTFDAGRNAQAAVSLRPYTAPSEILNNLTPMWFM